MTGRLRLEVHPWPAIASPDTYGSREVPKGKESDALPNPDRAVVTGAFSYIGRYVARCLLDYGVAVRTLTLSPDRDDTFGGLVAAAPLDFFDPESLRRSMEGVDVLYNTYWIRFGRGRATFEQAVENTRTLFAAAAGVWRNVHFSVVNASPESRLPYFRGKGQVGEIIRGMGSPTP